jgi:hypothetical protein
MVIANPFSLWNCCCASILGWGFARQKVGWKALFGRDAYKCIARHQLLQFLDLAPQLLDQLLESLHALAVRGARGSPRRGLQASRRLPHELRR